MPSLIVTPYVLISAISTTISLISAIFLLSRKRGRFGNYLTAMMIFMTWWCLFSAFDYATTDVALKVNIRVIGHIGSMGLATMFFFSAMEFAGFSRWSKPRFVIGCFIYIAIIITLFFTNNLHHIFWTSFTVDPVTNNLIPVKTVFWLVFLFGYVYLLFFLGLIILLRASIRMVYPSNLHAGILFVSFFLPLVGNFIFLSYLSPIKGFDPSHAVFAVTGLVLTVAVSRMRLLQQEPLDYQQVVNAFSEPVFFVDSQGNLAFMNGPAIDFLSQPGNGFLNQTPKLGANINMEQLIDADHFIVSTASPKEPRTYTAKVIPSSPHGHTSAGKLVLLTDVTAMQKAQQTLQMAALAKERESLIKNMEDETEAAYGRINQILATIQQLMDSNNTTAAWGMLNTLSTTIQAENKELRRSFLGLEMQMQDVRDFSGILQAYIAKFQQITGLRVLLSLPATPIENAVVQKDLFSAMLTIQEALALATSLNGVTLVQVVITDQQNKIQLHISFDADIEHLEDNPHIVRMQQLAEHIGIGTANPTPIQLRSSLGEGTHMLLDLPKNKPQTQLALFYSTRILLADRRRVEGAALAMLLRDAGIRNVSIATNLDEVLRSLKSKTPHLLLANSHFGAQEGAQLAGKARDVIPSLPILYYGDEPSDETLLRVANENTNGFLLTGQTTEEFFDGLAEVLGGLNSYSPTISNRLAKLLVSNATPSEQLARQALTRAGLSTKQIHIAELLAQGKLYKEIGMVVSLTEPSIKYHIDRIQDLLGVSSRADLLLRLAELGLRQL